MNKQNKVIFLSDMHLLADKDELLYQCNTYDRLQFIVEDILKNEDHLAALILMGDLSQDGSNASYQNLKTLLKQFTCPIFSIPGNHDDINNLEIAFSGSNILTEKHFSLFHWNFLALNTVLEGANYGLITTHELSWLEKTLIQLADEKVILLMHHHPTAISTPLIDQFILQNNSDFFEVIKNKTNINLIVFGHVHNAVTININKLQFLSCPSTCFQFLHGTTKLNLNTRQIGYRWLEIDDDKLLSGVKMLDISN